VGSAGFSDEQFPSLRTLLAQLLAEEQVTDYVLWFYTPLALPLADGLRPEAVIYDCMDELAAFLHAPPQLLPREAELLRRADLVFTGGPSLYRAKKDRHPSVHCFPSSVDAKHFGKARDGLPEAADQAAVQCDLPYAYVVYDHARPKNVAVIREWLAGQDIVLAGRYSEWEYYNSDHAFLAGKKAADKVRQLQGQGLGAAAP